VDLFHAGFDGVSRFARARCGDRSVAEDVAADTFHAAAKLLAGDADETIGRGWLLTVARRRIIDHWRRTERDRRRVARVLEWGEASTEHGRGPADDSDEMTDRVLRALRSLPQRQRLAVALRYLDDYSVNEISEQLGLDYRAAESLVARGRRNFKKAWEAA